MLIKNVHKKETLIITVCSMLSFVALTGYSFIDYVAKDKKAQIAQAKRELANKNQELRDLKNYVSVTKKKLEKLNGYETNYTFIQNEIQSRLNDHLIEKTRQRFGYYHYRAEVQGVEPYEKCVNKVQINTRVVPVIPQFQNEKGQQVSAVLFKSYLELKKNGKKINPRYENSKIVNNFNNVNFVYKLKKVR